MNTKLLPERQAKLDYAIHFCAALDNIYKHEADTESIQASITSLLLQLGYAKAEAYAAAIGMEVAMATLGGVSGGFAFDDNRASSLSALIMTAATMIDSGHIDKSITEKIAKLI